MKHSRAEKLQHIPPRQRQRQPHEPSVAKGGRSADALGRSVTQQPCHKLYRQRVGVWQRHLERDGAQSTRQRRSIILRVLPQPSSFGIGGRAQNLLHLHTNGLSGPYTAGA